MRYYVLTIFCLLFLFSGCKDAEVEKKIEPKLKAHLMQMKESNRLDERVTILFKINEELTDLHKEVMQDKGVEISANIGDIYTATIPAKSMYSFAKFRFVDYIEGQTLHKAHPADSTINKIR